MESGFLGVIWRLRFAIASIAVIVGVLAMFPSFIERISPRLNDLLHSETPTTTSDIEFNLTRIAADMKQIDAACLPGTPGLKDNDEPVAVFTECRRQILSTRPAYDDLKLRFEQFERAWGVEKSQRSVPADCREGIDGLYPHLDSIIQLKREEYDMLQSVNPETATRIEMGKAMRRLGEIEGAQVAQEQNFKPDELTRIEGGCKGF
jgi:hypothetical protein